MIVNLIIFQIAEREIYKLMIIKLISAVLNRKNSMYSRKHNSQNYETCFNSLLPILIEFYTEQHEQ